MGKANCGSGCGGLLGRMAAYHDAIPSLCTAGQRYVNHPKSVFLYDRLYCGMWLV